MGKLRVLFIGGSGVISSACSRAAVQSGIELSVLNRGQSTIRPLPPGVTMLRADIREPRTVWQYSRDKIACEDLLVGAYREQGFPATIVRPSHTYDQTLVPFDGGRSRPFDAMAG